MIHGAGGYSGGVFGQSFNFTALGGGVSIPPHASLNVGIGDGLTISAWILARGTVFQNPTPENPFIYGSGPIVEYDKGAQIWAHNQQNSRTGLFTNLIEPSGTWHILQTPTGLDTLPLLWRHVAVTYSRLTGWQQHFIDGMPTYGELSGLFVSKTSDSLRIGARAIEVVGGSAFTFNGAIDEVQIYDRALTALEVLQIGTATGTMCVPPPASYRIDQLPVGSGESGVPFTTQPRIAILDAAGNVVINATNAVTVTASGTGTLTGTTTVNAVNGYATFINLALQGTGTTSTTLTFTSGSLPVVGPASPPGALGTTQTARKLGITTQPGGAVTGALLAPQPVVQVQDAAGLAMPGAANPVLASIGSGAGSLGGTTTVNANNATAAFSTLTVTGLGPFTLAFSSPGLTGATSNPFDISVLPPSLRIVTQAAGGENGVPFTTQPIIEALDAGGQRDLSANVTVFVRVYTGSGTLGGTETVHVINGLATFTDLKVTGPSNVILEYGATAYLGVLSANLPIVQVVRQLVVLSGPTSIISGLLMPTWTVELRDATGLKVANSTAAVKMEIATGSGQLSGATQKNAVAGVAMFNNVIATALAPLTFKFSLVTPPPPPSGAVLVTSGPVSVTAGGPTFTWNGFFEPIDNLPKVNSVEAGSTIPIKFSLGGDKGMNIFAAGYPASRPASCTDFAPTGAEVPIGTAAEIAAGLKYNDHKYQINWKTVNNTWDGTCRILIVKLADGSSHTAHFKFKGNLPATQLVMQTQPAGAESGKPFTTQPVIEVRDATGARATKASGTVTVSIASGTGGTLAGDVTESINDGLVRFDDLKINGPGTFTLKFTASGLTTATSASLTVTQAVRQVAFIAGPVTLISGNVMTPAWQVEMRDAAGIKVATSTQSVKMTLASGTGTLSGTSEVNAVAGVATFSALKYTGNGPITLKAASNGAYAVSGAVSVQGNSTTPGFTWTGFFSPISNLPTVNTPEAGSTIPIKFSLGGNKGLNIFANGYPASQAASCSSWTPTGAITAITVKGSWGNDDDDDDDYEYDHDYDHCHSHSNHHSHRHKKSSWKRDDDKQKSNGSSSADAMKAALKYDDGKYTINWKTDSKWENDCRILIVKLTDGTSRTARFKFKD